MDKGRDILDEFLEENPEEDERVRQRSLERRRALSVAYQLGYYIGEKIVNEFLPCLEVDSIRLGRMIDVTPEEKAENERLNKEWHDNYDRNKEQGEDPRWEALRAHHRMLEDKYLPEKLECSFRVLHVPEQSEYEFKSGLGVALWDCDMSHYHTSAERITIRYDEDGYLTYIILERA